MALLSFTYASLLSLAVCGTIVGADKLDEVLASAIFPASSHRCPGAGSKTSFRTSYTSTNSISEWNSENSAHESDVFQIDMIHNDDDTNRDWTLRLGKGGQVSSFIVAAGETISNQAVAHAAWNDLVQQMVAVNMDLNDVPNNRNFIHQAGPYMKDTG